MRLLISIALAAALYGQTPAPQTKLEYSGKPLTVGSKCTADMVQSIGLSCTAQDPCPLFLELSDVELVGNRVLLSGNLHTSSATLESLLLVSEDLGRTWGEGHARLASAVLDQIQFLDFELGWISGHVLERQPRDAFFLVTKDGGRAWSKRVVYGEPHPGSIEQFWFDSRSHGTMVFDKGSGGETGMRHELYESMTGGDSWDLRQVDSKPIPVKRPSVAAPGWRLRADSRLKAYVVERQSEGKWHAIASFAIAAGECRPAEPDAEPEVVTPEAAKK